MRYSYVDGPVAAAHAPADERADFIRKTYLHLGGAILAFTALTALIVNSPLAEMMVGAMMAGGQMGWLVVLGLFMFIGFVAERWAQSSSSKGMQYAGLGLYVVAEAVIFTPLLYIAAVVMEAPDLIAQAGIMTLSVFGGLTAVAFFSKKDFSFLGRFLAVAGFAAMGLIIVAVLFGLSLGSWFSMAMVVLAAGYILYYTSRILHHYPIGSHVAASLNLFAAVALLFWYILQLFMSRD